MALMINDLTGSGAPKVEVLLTGLDSSVASVTGYRSSGGYTEPVAGMINAPVSGGLSRVDFEVPAQTTSYRVEMFDVDGLPLGFTDPVEVTLGFTGCWMHNPLAPDGAVRVTLIDTAGRSMSRPVPGEIVYPRGRRVGIVVSDPRRGVEGGVFDVYSPDLQTADRIQAFLGGPDAPLPPVVCIRPGVDQRIRVHSPLFLGVMNITEEDATYRLGKEGLIQRITGSEVSRPAPGLFIPLLRRMDLNAFYASREDLNNAYLTRLDANRDYSLAGFAG